MRPLGLAMATMVVILGLVNDRRLTMTNAPDRHARSMLPIPDRPAPGLTTYDAKDRTQRFR